MGLDHLFLDIYCLYTYCSNTVKPQKCGTTAKCNDPADSRSRVKLSINLVIGSCSLRSFQFVQTRQLSNSN